MKLSNILIRTTLNSKRIVAAALLLQLMIALLAVNPVSVIREIVCILYIAFLPGLLILFLLKIKLDFTDTLLFSLGLSLSSVMFLVAAFNVSRFLGLEKPISQEPLLFLLACFIILLSSLCCLRGRDFYYTLRFEVSPLVLLLVVWLMSLSIAGAYQLVAYHSNLLLLLFYGIVSIFPMLVAFDKISKNLYPLLIWIMSLSLLLPWYIFLNCVAETIMPGVVVRLGFWDPTVLHGHNSLLFDVALHPTFFYIGGFENILTELKVVVPFVSSFIPLILYQLFKKITDDKTAFMSSSLFIFFFLFYSVTFPRQMHAELFLALLLLSAFHEKLERKKRSLFFILFSFSLIASHYGTSYFFMLALLSSFFILKLFRKLDVATRDFNSINLFTSPFLILYGAMVLLWYMYTSGSTNFFTLVIFFNFFLERLTELFSPEASHALGALTRNWASVSIEILKYLTLLICGLIALGVFQTLCSQIKERKLEGFLILSASFLIMLGSTLLPISGGFDTFRIFHLSLILLAPFSVIGLKFALRNAKGKNADKHLILFAGLSVVFFLLNSGFIAEFIPNDYSSNAYINKEKIIKGDNIQAKYLLYRQYYMPEQNLQCGEWIKSHGDLDKELYVDILTVAGKVLISSRFGQLPEEIKLPSIVVLNKNIKLVENSYIFLAYHNTIEKQIFILEKNSIVSYSTKDLSQNISRIYDNGAGKILYVI
jgi:uncharacterized membrane protein